MDYPDAEEALAMKCSIDGCPGTYESESVAHDLQAAVLGSTGELLFDRIALTERHRHVLADHAIRYASSRPATAASAPPGSPAGRRSAARPTHLR